MILYYFNWHIPAYISGVVASDMEQQLNEGKEVFLLTCRGVLKPCWNNMEGDEAVCRACRFNYRSNVVFNDPRVKVLFVDDFLSTRALEQAFVTSRLMDYHDVESIKDLEYEGMALGFGAFSSYVSYTRINQPVIDDEFREYFDQLLKVELSVIMALKSIQEQYNVDRMVIYNGRLHDVRPALLFAQQQSLPLRVLESIRVSVDQTYACEIPGLLPQDIAYKSDLIQKVWQNAPMDPEKRNDIARSFYLKRRNNILTQDRVVYTKAQKRGLLPENWDLNHRNVVIFNSSEDEFTSLGRDWDSLSLFGSQLKGVEHICSFLMQEPQTRVYVRVHPNLKGNQYHYHLGLYELEKEYSNLTVIPPDSSVSTYAMMDAMDLGVSFGGSAGIESSFIQKPVILLEGSYYYHLNACYTPQTEEDLYALLLKPLEPKPELGAMMYGFYMSYPEGYSHPFKYEVKPQKTWGISSWKTPHLLHWGSQTLYKTLYFGYQKYLSQKNKGLKSIVPIKESVYNVKTRKIEAIS